MFFLRKRRHKRDREAGLTFHWRGARKHHFGKIIALVLVCGLFAFSVYAIRIDGIKAPLLSPRKGVVIMLNEDDPSCRKLLLQVEDRSPFPVRWDPVSDENVMARLDEGESLLFGKLWDHDVVLLPLPGQKTSQGLASITELFRGVLSDGSGRWRQAGVAGGLEEQGDLFIRARVFAVGELKTRIVSNELALPAGLVAEDVFGQVFRFQVGLDESGHVSTCIPLPGGTSGATMITDRHKNLAAWLRTQRFDPADPGSEGVVAGPLELQIEASRE